MYENVPIVPLAPGVSQSVMITFTINEMFAGNSIVNTAEIAYQDDDADRTNTLPTDVDSIPDTDQTNDDPTDGDITNDEDDHDDEMISLGGPRLAGTIYHDTNNSDSYDTNDIPLSGLVVTLTNGSGDVVATTTTDAVGDYSFENLVADTYSVSYDPATQDPTLHPDGLTVYADSNQIGNEGGASDGLQTITDIQLDGTDTGVDYDFGLIATSSL